MKSRTVVSEPALPVVKGDALQVSQKPAKKSRRLPLRAAKNSVTASTTQPQLLPHDHVHKQIQHTRCHFDKDAPHLSRRLVKLSTCRPFASFHHRTQHTHYSIKPSSADESTEPFAGHSVNITKPTEQRRKEGRKEGRKEARKEGRTKRPNDQTTKRPNDQTTKRPTNNQTTKRSNDQTTERPNDQTTKRPNDQTTKRPNDQTNETTTQRTKRHPHSLTLSHSHSLTHSQSLTHSHSLTHSLSFTLTVTAPCGWGMYA